MKVWIEIGINTGSPIYLFSIEPSNRVEDFGYEKDEGKLLIYHKEQDPEIYNFLLSITLLDSYSSISNSSFLYEVEL